VTAPGKAGVDGGGSRELSGDLGVSGRQNRHRLGIADRLHRRRIERRFGADEPELGAFRHGHSLAASDGFDDHAVDEAGKVLALQAG
jgi:hypothetical protein